MSTTAALPFLGSGLGFRRELADQTLAAQADIDFLEIVVEEFLERRDGLDELRRIIEIYPVIPHGLGLSIGTAGPLDRDYLTAITRVSDVSGSPYYSDHLCMTRVPGIDLGQLAPMWFDTAALRGTIDRVNQVQDALGKPLVLENVTYLVELPGSDLSQPEFFGRLVEATGCGILLDVTNVYTNAVNHGFDPHQFLAEMPLDAVVQVHLAGGIRRNGILMDSHSHPVPPEVWKLFADLCARADIKAALLEYDQNYPDFADLTDQIATARRIMSG